MNVWSARARMPWLAVILAAAAGALLLVATSAAQTPVPTTPPASITPAPAGTPWPPPTGLQLTGYFILLDENNFPLPPEKQTRYSGVSWAVLSGFTGTYEVQHAVLTVRSPNEVFDWQPVVSGPFPASSAIDGRIGFEELVPVPDTHRIHCYRVRTVIDSAGGPETGPYSAPLCSPQPPSSGGPPPATASASPLPPEVGNTPLTTSETGWLAAAAGVAGVVLLLAGAISLRRR